ncbi:unnamed protein product [Mytilus edulis]|uniref:Uncharacterized protein n=1 Tax=Mytilus edulis TaxID=6550 RepID=A0A8S3QZI0_MYTED|nr:unnamed protein product [Mytilus edulis]
MDLKQKEHVFKKFQNANLKSRHHEEDEGMFVDNTDHSGALTVTAGGSGITSVPFPILKGIFEKAATLYHSQSDIVSFPGKPGAANIIGKYFITSSTDAAKPHLVTVLGTGQVTCDSNCPRWEMYKVCSHSIAAAEHCNLLEKFVKWFKTKTISLNLTGLANLNMPCGRGKKPHKATQKRKGKANKRNETALAYLDEHDQPQVPPPRPPDGGYVIYFLKDCDNKVSKCYGCKGNLKHEGQIPQPPGDLVVVSRGRREYFKDGTKLYGEINNIYFHLSEQCIKSKNTFFVPSLVYVAPYVASQFQQKHKDLLDQCSVTYNI